MTGGHIPHAFSCNAIAAEELVDVPEHASEHDNPRRREKVASAKLIVGVLWPSTFDPKSRSIADASQRVTS